MGVRFYPFDLDFKKGHVKTGFFSWVDLICYLHLKTVKGRGLQKFRAAANVSLNISLVPAHIVHILSPQ